MIVISFSGKNCHQTKKQHFNAYETGISFASDFLNAASISPKAQNISMTPKIIQTECGIPFSDATARSELENFQIAPIMVCRASRI